MSVFNLVYNLHFLNRLFEPLEDQGHPGEAVVTDTLNCNFNESFNHQLFNCIHFIFQYDINIV